MSWISKGLLLFFCAVSPALAQIPDAPNCKIEQPPPDAGAYATPGGFLLVHPRNVHLTDDYTGCKVLWIVDAPDRFHRLMTLYFERGKLRIALGYDGRGANELRVKMVVLGVSCALNIGWPASVPLEAVSTSLMIGSRLPSM